MKKKLAISVIESFFNNPVFHFGVEAFGRDEKMYVTGYIQGLVETGYLTEKDADKFWDKLK